MSRQWGVRPTRACLDELGAVTRLTDHDLEHESESWGAHALRATHRWWLGRVGMREDGSRRDFYDKIAADCACARTRAKNDGINTDHLLPAEWDRKRLVLEDAWAQRQVYKQVMLQAAAKSLRSGKVVTAEFSTFSMGACDQSRQRPAMRRIHCRERLRSQDPCRDDGCVPWYLGDRLGT